MAIIAFVDHCRGEYFFSTDRLQPMKDGHTGDQYHFWSHYKLWVHTLPIKVVPRPTLPSGVVQSKADVVTVYYPNYTEISNPDQAYQPKV